MEKTDARVIIITGAAMGLGLATAKEAASKGMSIIMRRV